jgi:hypothetical protein
MSRINLQLNEVTIQPPDSDESESARINSCPSNAGSERELFADRERFIALSSTYGDLADQLLLRAGELSTPTEEFMFRAFTEFVISGNKDHLDNQLRLLQSAKPMDSGESLFFSNAEQAWWPSAAEHLNASDYVPSIQSFTQLTAIFLEAHYEPASARHKLEELKKDPVLYDKVRLEWTECRLVAGKAHPDGKTVTSRDQLMEILILSLCDRDEARTNLNSFRASAFFRESKGTLVESLSDSLLYEERYQASDRLLWALARVYTASPEDRRSVFAALKSEEPIYHSSTGCWVLQTPYEMQVADLYERQELKGPTMISRLLSLVLDELDRAAA